MKNELNKIKKYIEDNYGVVAEISPTFLFKNNLLLKTEKYDINISLCKAEENHYLYGKYKTVLFFDYEANKKYQSELCFHGGGCSKGYDKNDYSNIEQFLNHWFEKSTEKQFTIFDYI